MNCEVAFGIAFLLSVTHTVYTIDYRRTTMNARILSLECNCDQTAKNPVIVKMPPDDYYVEEGSSAILQWLYCKPSDGLVTGIIVSRGGNLLSIDVAGVVTHYPPNNHHNNITWTKENGSITFIIRNISMNDRGRYVLKIRMVGYPDLANKVNVVVRKAVGLGRSNLTSYHISITKTSNQIYSSTKRLPADQGRNKEILVTHTSRTTEIHSTQTITNISVSTKKSLEIGLSNDLTVSKTHIVEENEEKYDIIVIIVVCVLAGLAPIGLLSLVITVYKLRRRQIKRRKTQKNIAHNPTSIQLQERDLEIHHQRGETSNGELYGSFSASSMSGFSYRDSLEDEEASEEEPPSTITFGIAQSLTPRVFRDLPPIITHTVKQEPNCPLLPERNHRELKRELIRDMQIVGQGAFGLVAKANLIRRIGQLRVAVKMLKEFASDEDRRDLIAECHLMRRLDPHKNVVQLLGFVLQTEPIWVVTEYVDHGDLLGFLRKCCGIQDSIYHGVATYCGSSLTQQQLLKMATDIARGMAHLAQNKIIHRDLAARNVLVDKNINCKITDFGMARDVKSTNYYRTKNRGRIPFKWTAIEALLYDKYTTMSDVWSYGIVLYEIVTIGGSPYPRLGPREILRRLKRGWRMQKPAHVSTELYNVMLMCWAANPEERLSFIDLSGIFNNVLGNRSEYINIEEYKCHLYDSVQSSSESSTGSLNELLV